MAGTPLDPDARPARLEALPSWWLTQASARSHRLLADALRAEGARGHHYRLLAALAEFGSANQASLGRRTDVDGSDVVASLKELEATGLVDREPDPTDRRSNVIAITAAGKRRLARLDRVLAAVQEQLLEPLTRKEREDFVRLVAKLGRAQRPRPQN